MSISIGLYPILDLWTANKLHYITLQSAHTQIQEWATKTTTTNYQHHHNHQGKRRTIMANTNKTKRHLPDHTNCSVRFRDVRGSKIRDMKSPSVQHINKETCSRAHTHLCGLKLVRCDVHLKAKRSALCWSNSSVHTQLTLSFRKVRHIFIYVLVLSKAFVQ